MDSILNNEFLFYYDVISDGCDGHTISLIEFVDKALFFLHQIVCLTSIPANWMETAKVYN